MFDLEALKKQLPDMPDDEVQNIILTLYLYHKIPAVMVFYTWDDLVSSASVAEEYRNYPFSHEDKRELCNATEDWLSLYSTPKIINKLNEELETLFLRKKTEEKYYG